MKKNKGLVFFASIFFSVNLLAQDISGTWQQIDDKTGSPKSIIEIRKEANNTFTGKITNWKDVGGDDEKIVAYSRESSAGTFEFFKEQYFL